MATRAHSGSNDVLQIKRYPNRRFYARHSSKYVSLPDIEEMIREGNTVEIRDHETGDDITRNVLTQIIVERHPEKVAVFPVDMLHLILRANDVMSDTLRTYFRDSLTYLKYFQQHGGSMPLANPLQWMNAWVSQARSASEADQADLPSEEGATPSEEEHPGALAERIAALEERLRQLENVDENPSD